MARAPVSRPNPTRIDTASKPKPAETKRPIRGTRRQSRAGTLGSRKPPATEPAESPPRPPAARGQPQPAGGTTTLIMIKTRPRRVLIAQPFRFRPRSPAGGPPSPRPHPFLLLSSPISRAEPIQDGNGYKKNPQIRGYQIRWARIRVWNCTRGHGHGYNPKPNGYLETGLKICYPNPQTRADMWARPPLYIKHLGFQFHSFLSLPPFPIPPLPAATPTRDLRPAAPAPSRAEPASPLRRPLRPPEPARPPTLCAIPSWRAPFIPPRPRASLQHQRAATYCSTSSLPLGRAPAGRHGPV